MLDTNVLISAIIFGGVPRSLLQLVLRSGVMLVTSEFLMSEFEQIIVWKFKLPLTVARAIRLRAGTSNYHLVANRSAFDSPGRTLAFKLE